MKPIIKNGEEVSVDLSFYENQLPSQGDIVLFHSFQKEGKDWAMQVVGLPGEVVSFDNHGLLIDGKPLEPNKININYNFSESMIGSSKYLERPFKIPENVYYVLDDNLNEAYDSRFW